MAKQIYKKEYNAARKRNKSIGVFLTMEELEKFKKACTLKGKSKVDFIIEVVEEVLKDE